LNVAESSIMGRVDFMVQGGGIGKWAGEFDERYSLYEG
jgi:hypothetical protein